MFDYNYLIEVPKGHLPQVNQMLYNVANMKKTHTLIPTGSKNYVMVNKCDLNEVEKNFRKMSLPFICRKTAIQTEHIQK
jgi:hypothetical protein